jgi:transposase
MAMSLQPQEIAPVPEETERIARAAFPKGNIYLRLRDEIGTIFDDPMFAPLFPARGQPAECPWQLALITVMQFIEGLSDCQAADAVRSRIDWKYALGLELTDPGGDASVLCEFRARLIAGNLEQALLETMLARFKERGLLKARGQQRTDSTHVLAAVRTLNRLESIGETLRAALNSLATVAPVWLADLVAPDWFERYATRVEEYRLPKGEAARTALGERIGADGHTILVAVYAPSAPAWLRELPAVQTLRRAWVHQFHLEDDVVRWRKAADLPPAGTRFDSPYDTDARYGNKRSTTWTGYKVHLTETSDADTPHLITHVETTSAPVSDIDMTAPIHQALADKGLLPAAHLADAGYVDADLLISSHRDHEIDLVGPVRPDTSWQAKAGQGFDVPAFTIDWEARTVICPEGQTSFDWVPSRDSWGNDTIHIGFHRKTCAACPSRSLCTRSKTGPREITVRPQPQHEALQEVRRNQETEAWRARYRKRAGVEGTVSQAVRVFGLRRCRYLGLAKTRLQHIFTALALIFTALALNVVRLDAWLTGQPLAKTRRSVFASLKPLIV